MQPTDNNRQITKLPLVTAIPAGILLITGIALVVLGSLQVKGILPPRIGPLSFKNVNGWKLVGAGAGTIGVIACLGIAHFKIKTTINTETAASSSQGGNHVRSPSSLPEPEVFPENPAALEALIEKNNNAPHIPLNELRELIEFLCKYGDVQNAIENGSLLQITELNLAGKKIEALPDSIQYLSSLQKLDINNNKLTRLPDSIGKLTSLTELNISHNLIITLPDSMGNLASLEKLNATNTLIVMNPTIDTIINKLTSKREFFYSNRELGVTSSTHWKKRA